MIKNLSKSMPVIFRSRYLSTSPVQSIKYTDKLRNDKSDNSSNESYSPLKMLENFMANDTEPMKRSRKVYKQDPSIEEDEFLNRSKYQQKKRPSHKQSSWNQEDEFSNEFQMKRSSNKAYKQDQSIEEDEIFNTSRYQQKKTSSNKSYKQDSSIEEDEFSNKSIYRQTANRQMKRSTDKVYEQSLSNQEDEFSNESRKSAYQSNNDAMKLMYSREPVDGEPVPPAKNRYINLKNPALNAFRPDEGVDESNASFFLFPGQGSQFVGMGKKLLGSDVAKDIYRIASTILGYDLEEICLQGPEDKLNQTFYAQPAVFVTSLAAIEKFRLENPGVVENCIGTAGFSLGELTALVFGGAISFEDGLRLVKIRAEEMQKACEQTTSGLMTVIYGNDGRVEQACKAAADFCVIKGVDPEHAICSVANYLFPHCKVVGGHLEALDFIQKHGKDFGIKRCKRIPVSGAFHTKLMIPAKERFIQALQRTGIHIPTKIPIYCNYDGLPYLTKKEIQFKLPQQIHQPVKWEQTMFTTFTREQHEDHPWIFECGPGTNLITILKNVNARAYLKAKHIDV